MGNPLSPGQTGHQAPANNSQNSSWHSLPAAAGGADQVTVGSWAFGKGGPKVYFCRGKDGNNAKLVQAKPVIVPAAPEIPKSKRKILTFWRRKPESDLLKLQRKIAEVSAYPVVTKRSETLVRQLRFQIARQPQLYSKHMSLEEMRKTLRETADALLLEKPAIDVALIKRSKCEAKWSALQPVLRIARTIYDIDGTFSVDINKFKSLDRLVHEAIADQDYGLVDIYLGQLEPAAQRLTARAEDFHAKSGPYLDLEAEVSHAKFKAGEVRMVPRSSKSLLKLRARLEFLEEQMDEAYAAYDWSSVKAKVEELNKIADEMYQLADQAVEIEHDFFPEYTELRQLAQVYMKDVPIYSQIIQAKKEKIQELMMSMEKNLEAGNMLVSRNFFGDLRWRLLGIPDKKLGIPDKKEADIAEKDADIATWQRYEASFERWKQIDPELKEALAIRPMTKDGLIAYRTFQDARAAFARAMKTGEMGCDEMLTAYHTAAKAVIERNDVEKRAVEDVKKKYETLGSRVNTIFADAAKLADKHEPYFVNQIADMQAAIKESSGFVKEERYGQACAAAERAEKFALSINGGGAAAEKASAKLKIVHEERAKTLFPRVMVWQREDDGLSPELKSDQAKLMKVIENHNAAKDKGLWYLATQYLDDLETFLGKWDSRKSDLDKLRPALKQFRYKQSKIHSTIEKAMAITNVTQAMAEKKGTLKQIDSNITLAVEQQRFGDAEGLLKDFRIAARQVLNLKKTNYSNMAAYMRYKEYKVEAHKFVKDAQDVMPLSPALKALKDSMVKRGGIYQSAVDRFEFDTARKQLAEVVEAAKALIVEAGRMTTDNDGNTSTVYQLATRHAEERYTEAVKKIEVSIADLKTLPFEEKLQLLDDLHAKQQPLTDAERSMQSKLYNAMQPDQGFIELEKRRADLLVLRIMEDERLLNASKNWASIPFHDRITLLREIVLIQCGIYGMPEPMIVSDINDIFTDARMNFQTNQIVINSRAYGNNYFFEFLGAIVHENAHNYQHHLALRLKEGLIDTNDVEYNQARQFAVNFKNYISPTGNDDKDYKRQPIEAHAFKLEDYVAKAVEKKLSEKAA